MREKERKEVKIEEKNKKWLRMIRKIQGVLQAFLNLNLNLNLTILNLSLNLNLAILKMRIAVNCYISLILKRNYAIHLS